MENTIRKWIRLVEQQDDDLFWFWYRPSDGTLKHIDGTHTTEAYYNMGYSIEGEDIDELADEDVLSRVLNDGWVRGRYGHRKSHGGWNALMTKGHSDLSLQGKRDLVLKTARYVAANHQIDNLFLDFTINGAVHDAMDSLQLSGDQIEIYLRRGILPRVR